MITVNGNKIPTIDNVNISSYLRNQSYKLEFIVVECNGSIIPKAQYEEKILKDGDSLEIVTFVGGG